MKKLRVFFQENPKDLPAAEYLKAQEPWQRTQLERFVTDLETARKLEHPDARNLGDGKWSLWVRFEGKDAVNHICYLADKPADELSPLASLILNPSTVSGQSGQRAAPRRLEIIGGSSRPGEAPESSNRSPENYCLLMDELQAKAFLEVIAAIRGGIPSPYYTDLCNGSYSIHLDRSDLAYGVHIHCTARWVE